MCLRYMTRQTPGERVVSRLPSAGVAWLFLGSFDRRFLDIKSCRLGVNKRLGVETEKRFKSPKNASPQSVHGQGWFPIPRLPALAASMFLTRSRLEMENGGWKRMDDEVARGNQRFTVVPNQSPPRIRASSWSAHHSPTVRPSSPVAGGTRCLSRPAVQSQHRISLDSRMSMAPKTKHRPS